LIVTATDASVVAMKPGIVADTVVLPGLPACSATPPCATVVAEFNWPAGSVTVTCCPVSAVVTSCATAGLLFVIVTVNGAPARGGCSAFSAVCAAFGRPTRIQNGSSADNEVAAV